MIRIVIVEDSPIIIEGIKLLIKKINDFEIIGEYHNGKEFIASLSHDEPDIVLTDIIMPIMDGISMTKLVAKLKPQLKIIALSMHTERKYLIEMVKAGASGYITNKSSANELEIGIREVNSGKNYLSKNLLNTIVLNTTEIRSQIRKLKKLLPSLSGLELKILLLLSHDYSETLIAQRFKISNTSLEHAIAIIYDKTKTTTKNGLLFWLIKNTFYTF